MPKLKKPRGPQPMTISDDAAFVADAPPVAAAPQQRGPAPVAIDDESAFVPEGAETEPTVSRTEAFLRGAGQGATLGFGDEVKGLGSALFDNIARTLKGEDTRGTFASKYRVARDEDREANRKAAEERPGWYTGGNIAGSVATSFVPGLNVAKGAGVLSAAKQAAKIGAISGVGESEADSLPGVARDAATSGIVGGVTGRVVTKLLRGAPERVVKRALGDITDGATATMRDRVVGKAGSRVGDVLDILKDKTFKKAGRDAGKLLSVTEEAISDTGQRLDSAFRGAGKNTAGIRVADVLGDVEGIARRLSKDPGKADLARAVQNKAEDVLNSWGDRTHVSAQDVRTLASDIADTAFRGSPAVAPKQGQAVSQEVWGVLKDRIMKNLDEAAKSGGPARREIESLNKRMSTLLNMREAVRYRATREATESTRLKDRISGGLDIGLALAEPSMFVAKKGYDWVGKPAFRKGDEWIAELVTAARNGSKPAQIAERAVALGVSPLVAKAMANWIYRTSDDLAGGPVEATGP